MSRFVLFTFLAFLLSFFLSFLSCSRFVDYCFYCFLPIIVLLLFYFPYNPELFSFLTMPNQQTFTRSHASLLSCLKLFLPAFFFFWYHSLLDMSKPLSRKVRHQATYLFSHSASDFESFLEAFYSIIPNPA